MTPEQEQRLLAETIPDGTFGGPRPTPGAPPVPRARRPPRPVTAEEAARHRAELLVALEGFDSCAPAIAARGIGPRPPRHLHLVRQSPDRKAG